MIKQKQQNMNVSNSRFIFLINRNRNGKLIIGGMILTRLHTLFIVSTHDIF